MTELEIIKWIVFGIMGVAVWFMKRTIDSYDERIILLQREQQRIKEEYLHKNDFKDFKIELRGMFEDIKENIRSLQKHSQ